MKPILSADEMNFIVHWYVDGSHQIHKDCSGQIGCLMTMGKGVAISSSNIMKCNTQSSTETELISLHKKYLILYGQDTLSNAKSTTSMST